jgi:hypothetical protein
MDAHHHLVQFYEDDVFLIKGLADFIDNALSTGNTGIAIATADHLRMLDSTLRARRLLDAQGRARCGRYQPLQADKMLPLFMEDGMPDEERFRNAIGGVISAAAENGNAVHVFGEMVAILCATSHCSLQSAGKHDAAIRVERYFNNLQAHYPFSLLCAYPLNAFPSANDAAMFSEVCTADASGRQRGVAAKIAFPSASAKTPWPDSSSTFPKINTATALR